VEIINLLMVFGDKAADKIAVKGKLKIEDLGNYQNSSERGKNSAFLAKGENKNDSSSVQSIYGIFTGGDRSTSVSARTCRII
jgi:hypothetical protein